MIAWDVSFEAHPLGDDFGSVSCFSMRQLLEEFYARLGKEHTITEGPPISVVHTPGAASVCATIDGFPNTMGVVGGLQFDRAGHRLYIDDSALMRPISGLDHALFTLNALAVDAHTQYILYNSVTGFQELTGQLICGYVNNLDVTETDYTGYAGGYRGLVLPRTLHKGVAALGGNKHYDGIITALIGYFGRDILSITTGNVYSGNVNAASYYTVTVGDYSLMPYPDGGNNVQFQMYCPSIAAGGAFPVGALNPQFLARPNSGGNLSVSRAVLN